MKLKLSEKQELLRFEPNICNLLHGLSIVIKSGSKGNKFTVESIPDTFNTEFSLKKKVFSLFLGKVVKIFHFPQSETYCVLMLIQFFQADLIAMEWSEVKSKLMNQFPIEFYYSFL